MKRTKTLPIDQKPIRKKKNNIIPEGMIAKNALTSALLQVKPGLANKDIVEQSTHFIFENGIVWTFNDKITITRAVDVNIKGAVKAKEFYDLLVKFPDEHLRIEKESDGKIIVEGDGRIAEIMIDPEIRMQKPAVAGIRSSEWKELPKDFIDSVKFCVFSASKNMARPELTCIFVDEEFALSSDGFRATKKEMNGPVEAPFMIPSDAAIQLSKYNPTSYYLGDRGWLHFKNNEGTLFSCRTITERNYPSAIWDLFDVEGDTIKLPDGFLSIVDRAQTMVTEDFNLDRSINIQIVNRKIKCIGKGIAGKFSETHSIDWAGEKIDIHIHPEFLMAILKHLDTMIVGREEYEGRVLFKGDEFLHMISLSSVE